MHRIRAIKHPLKLRPYNKLVTLQKKVSRRLLRTLQNRMEYEIEQN